MKQALENTSRYNISSDTSKLRNMARRGAGQGKESVSHLAAASTVRSTPQVAKSADGSRAAMPATRRP